MSNKYVYLVLFLLVIPVILAAGSFSVYQGQDPGGLCPGTTGLFTDVVTNDGSELMQFTVSGSGSASAISTFVPMGFSLNPGQSKTVYTYVTPRTSTRVGNYNLDLVISSNGQSKALGHDIVVKNCFEFIIEALDTEKHVCPCESDKFDIKIINNGDYVQSYDLSVEGEAANSVTLSQDGVSVGAGETKTVYAYVKADCDDLGEYGFTVIADPEIGSLVQSVYATLVVDPCYDFNVQTDQDYVTFCEHTQKVIPIKVVNQGSTSNTYGFEIDGPAWANLDVNKRDVAADDSGIVNLILSPDYGIEGDFDVGFKAITQKGDLEASNMFNVKVEKCHAVDVSIQKDSDKICNSLENTYEVKVKNTGTTEKTYNIELLAPDWVTLQGGDLTLDSGQESILTLTVAPQYDVVSAAYQIKVRAVAIDSDKLSGEDVLAITTVSVDECYQVKIGINEKDIEVHYDGTATVPIVIENKGTYKANYDLGVSGTASSFVYLNPASLEIDKDKAEVIYLYIAPNAQVVDGDYEASVSVRLGDSTILASDTINIKVLDSKAVGLEEITGEAIEEVEGGASLWARIKAFFVRLFEQKEVEEPLAEIEDLPIEEIFEEEVEGEPVEEVVEEELVEEVIEEPVETEKLNLDDISLGSYLFGGEGTKYGLIVNGGEHEVTLQTTGEDYVVLEIRSELKTLILDVGESRYLDLDEDGNPDTKVTFNGFIDGEADIQFEKISAIVNEPVEEVVEEIPEEEIIEEITEETTTETEGEGFGLMKYRYHFITVLVILILILLAIKTNFHKKLVDFFEEEIEEEEVEVEPQKEEIHEENKKFMEEYANEALEEEKKVKEKPKAKPKKTKTKK
ncbi:MAG: hypothetical protein KKH88_02730 [Nanoarchaeota archaeon]|nr:hypothetical protein [Nanoarchaeota archaeon]